ncbi:adenine deaminase [Tepidibacter hydrothermalis]|uniref:Adenine deaminase n=1 Tax=Tepidibacter hydrothermalis TaxID=3036126 RepID=A0ABY8E8G4_9FIRM|nr:adenine deaminase [Tepidibacter hydrothermalis]WFD09183.1 adenine deaminase [Tepidibacter hydrothermalis]
MNNNMKNMIDMASGRKKSELVLKNCKVVNVFSHEIIEADIAIAYGKIVGVGNYSGEKEIDIKGRYVSPGLIDGHIHIESSMVSPVQFARAIVPRGTTTIIADPHEIANVCGLKGIEYMLNETKNIPLNVYIMLPSCVPATPFESSGAVLEADDLEKLIDNPRVLGLGELMNYPGVINCDDSVIKKVNLANEYSKIIDGHGPEISGKDLNAYVVSGVKTEHECSTVEEMMERIRLGMYIAIRQGSAAKNLLSLVKGITDENMRRCILCADDRHPEDLLNEGHIDNSVRIAIKNGIDPISAIKMASINTAECYNLEKLGAIAPGYYADLIVIDDLEEFDVVKVFKNGKLVSKNKKPLFNASENSSYDVKDTVNIKNVKKEDLNINMKTNKANVMGVIDHSILTKKVVRNVNVEDGLFKSTKEDDVLKIAVVERHNATGNIGLGLVENFGLKGGAIASTVAHDSHNIVVIGDNDEDMLMAINEVARVGGGITICSNSKILKTLELPIAGLMSDLNIEKVSEILSEMLHISYEKLNVNKNIEPFMTLAFLALPVIPEIKITDKGLFDVTKFDFIEINVD